MTGLFVAFILFLLITAAIALEGRAQGSTYPGISDAELRNMRDALLLDLHAIERRPHSLRGALDIEERIFLLDTELDRRVMRHRNAAT